MAGRKGPKNIRLFVFAGLHDADRLKPISEPFLRAQGARFYCWLRPGEKLVKAGEEGAGGESWAPCENGGFVYLFSSDPLVHSKQDCFFDCNYDGGDDDDGQAAPFPASLPTFSLTPTNVALHDIQLNFDDSTYQLPTSCFEDVEELQALAEAEVVIEGSFSPLHRLVTLREGEPAEARQPSPPRPSLLSALCACVPATSMPQACIFSCQDLHS